MDEELTPADYAMAVLVFVVLLGVMLWVVGYYEETYEPMPNTLPPRESQ